MRQKPTKPELAMRNYDITKFLEAEWPKTYYEWDEVWPDPPEITEAKVGVMLDDIDLDFDQRQTDYTCEMNTKLHCRYSTMLSVQHKSHIEL